MDEFTYQTSYKVLRYWYKSKYIFKKYSSLIYSEYISATFGSKPPIGPLRIAIADPFDACSPNIINNLYAGKFIIAKRGNCTFLEKALFARNNNISVLAIINTEDRLESVSSGLGQNPNITDEIVLSIGNLSIVSFWVLFFQILL